jgi:hypothetical protein
MAGPLRLLDFPDEILSLIAGQLESRRRDVCAFACVCVRVSDIADRYCYRRLLLSAEDHFERLSKAIQRKPWRLAFIQELTLVPPFHPTTNTVVGFPHFLLVSANMLQHLTVELPFHENYRAARSFKTEYQDQLGELFHGAPLVSRIPVPRPFHRLRSCKCSLSLVSEG